MSTAARTRSRESSEYLGIAATEGTGARRSARAGALSRRVAPRRASRRSASRRRGPERRSRSRRCGPRRCSRRRSELRRSAPRRAAARRSMPSQAPVARRCAPGSTGRARRIGPPIARAPIPAAPLMRSGARARAGRRCGGRARGDRRRAAPAAHPHMGRRHGAVIAPRRRAPRRPMRPRRIRSPAIAAARCSDIRPTTMRASSGPSRRSNSASSSASRDWGRTANGPAPPGMMPPA